MGILSLLIMLIAYDAVRWLFQKYVAPKLDPRVLKVLQWIGYGVAVVYVLSLIGVLPFRASDALTLTVVDWWGFILLLFSAVGVVETVYTLGSYAKFRGIAGLDPTQVQLYAIATILGMAAFGFVFDAFATTIIGHALDPNVQANIDRLISIAIGIAVGAASTAYVSRLNKSHGM